MAEITYKATIMDAQTGASSTYAFKADAGLFDRPRAELIATFMSHVDHIELPKEDVGYEIVSAFKDREHRCITCVGTLLLDRGAIPFMAMIQPEG